jgi:hypothetical protein
LFLHNFRSIIFLAPYQFCFHLSYSYFSQICSYFISCYHVFILLHVLSLGRCYYFPLIFVLLALCKMFITIHLDSPEFSLPKNTKHSFLLLLLLEIKCRVPSSSCIVFAVSSAQKNSLPLAALLYYFPLVFLLRPHISFYFLSSISIFFQRLNWHVQHSAHQISFFISISPSFPRLLLGIRQ